MMRIRTLLPLIIAAAGSLASGGEREETYAKVIQPLLKEYCITCHSTEKQKGELDLECFKTLVDIKKHPKVWQSVAEQLALGEMPPKKATPMPAADKEKLAAFVHAVLEDIAFANAGDPGPVLLRRLSNSEYTHTIRDLTGVPTLDPAKEFPVDGAAGEGFTNTGQSLVMSPALFKKYLDAGKVVAAHAVLLPDGIRFSPSVTRRDQTEEVLTQIREFYKTFTDQTGSSKFNLQGVVFEVKDGGRIPLGKYLVATIQDRGALEKGEFEAVANARGLSKRYLETLFKSLSSGEPSMILDKIRNRWKVAKTEDVAALVGEIDAWQKALWKYSPVGQIGKLNGPKAWMEPLSPLPSRQEIKEKLPADGKDVTVYLVTTDAGDGSEGDVALWHEPRLVAPGRPAIYLRDLRDACRQHSARRELTIATAPKALLAAAEAGAAETFDLAALAKKHDVPSDVLGAWFNLLGISAGGSVKIDNHLQPEIKNVGNYEFIRGWGKGETPLILANSSDQHVRIPGNMKPHSVAVHPSPKLNAVIGWRSPVAALLSVEAAVSRAHPECGNGVTWALELRRGESRRRLAGGTITDRQEKKAGPFEKVSVRAGDVISLAIGPHNNDHSCDLAAVDMTLTAGGEKPIRWNLAADVSPDVLAGNPHADSLGNKDVWHFYTEPSTGSSDAGPAVPPGSLLAKWQAAVGDEKTKLASEVQKLMAGNAPAGKDNPDAALHRQLTSLGGALLGKLSDAPSAAQTAQGDWGLNPALFGRDLDGQAIEPRSLCVRAPGVLEVKIPAELAAGAELVASGMLYKESPGSVQFQVLKAKPASQGFAHNVPIVVREGSPARQCFEKAFDDMRQLFPAALCYMKIVPTDEVVTLTLFHREDHHLARLMLDDAQRAKLDRLWDELRFISQDALALVDVFEQLWQYATQDGDPKSFEPLREPIKQGAEKLKKWMLDVQPRHVDAILHFADRAYRRPLTEKEKDDLRGLYKKLRDQELPHEEAVRLTLARLFVAPAFLYRAEKPGPGVAPGPVSDLELASRLSYFLWSSMPDDELRKLAEAGKLHEPAVLSAQARRMLKDPRVRRLATEFGCAWLHVSGFDELSEKSDRHFPTFVALRGAMYEETIHFFTDFFQNDGSVLSLLDADHTFLNEALAKHYGIPGVSGSDFRRVEGMKKFSRGGILGHATTLAKQSGASRTSPILRGNWVSEALLGDKLPKPPKDVPPLPEDEAVETLTVRQLTEKHSSDPRCASCHQRIDAFGFSLERFDAIGRFRDKDLGNKPIDTKVKAMDGSEFDGLDGLRNYLLTTKRDAFLKHFCKKLLGYSLGRAVQLSDESLLREMQSLLKTNDYRIGAAVDKIVQSSQFRNIRGIGASND